MAIFGNITERYNSYQLDYAINEMNNFCFVTEHVDTSYLTEGFFSNIFEKIKKLWDKFKNWVKEKIQWIKDKIRSIFGGKKKDTQTTSATKVMHDVDVDLTLETSFFVALDDVIEKFESSDIRCFQEYEEVSKMTFDGEDYQTQINEKQEQIRSQFTARIEELDKIKNDMKDSDNVKIKEVKIVAKRLSSFAGDLKEVNREIKIETYGLERLNRIITNTTSELLNHINKYDNLVKNFGEEEKKLNKNEKEQRAIIAFKTQVLNWDITANRNLMATFNIVISSVLKCKKRNDSLLTIMEELERKAFGDGRIDQKHIDSKNLKNYCKLEDAKTEEEGKK